MSTVVVLTQRCQTLARGANMACRIVLSGPQINAGSLLELPASIPGVSLNQDMMIIEGLYFKLYNQAIEKGYY